MSNNNTGVQKNQMNINPSDIEDLPLVQCKCGGQIFMRGNQIRKLSELHPKNTTRKSAYVYVDVTVCIRCWETLPANP